MQRSFWWFLLLMVISGCAGGSAGSQLVSDHEFASTQIADLRITTTVQKARIQTTVDFVETRVAQVATQSQFLKATLVQRGTPMADLIQFQEQVMEQPVIIEPASTQAANSTPTAPVVTLLAPPTAVPDEPRLEQPVMTLAVGPDDCAVGQTSVFSTNDAEIYVVARAYNVDVGTQFSSRWLLNGQQVVQHSFAAEFEFDDACIWFFIDETDTEFTPGSWSVVLEVNGRQGLAPIPFSIEAPMNDG